MLRPGGRLAVEPTRIHRVEDARDFLDQAGLDAEAIASHGEGKFKSALVRARKPAVRLPVDVRDYFPLARACADA